RDPNPLKPQRTSLSLRSKNTNSEELNFLLPPYPLLSSVSPPFSFPSPQRKRNPEKPIFPFFSMANWAAIRANPCRPCPFSYRLNASESGNPTPTRAAFPVRVSFLSELAAKASSANLKFAPLENHRRPAVVGHRKRTAVCALGGKDKAEDDSHDSAEKPLEKSIGSSRKKSVEELLRKQIEKKTYYDGGSSSNNPPRGGGGGRGGGSASSDGSGESKEDGFAEILQVILATTGFVLLYLYIIAGEEMIRLGRDYFVFLTKGKKSARLQRIMDHWNRIFERINERIMVDKYALEKAFLRKPTWFKSPQKSGH
ncbi:hypothetical protein Tsubulata_005831, partial [Turnera subulata]